jgi:heptosyltransferase-2/heptosyltransferase-3
VVRQLRLRGVGPTWFCDGNDAALPMLKRAGIPDEYIVDVKDHPLRPGEHATEQWVRVAQVMPDALAPRESLSARTSPVARTSAPVPTDLGPRADSAVVPGCSLEVSNEQRSDLQSWLRTRGLADAPLIAIQMGNKRTMRRGLRRLAVNSKYWPNERWAEVLRAVRARCPDHAIVLLGTGPEFALNEDVAKLAQISELHNVADDLPIPRLLALLSRAAGLITVDSGPGHAAAAVGCPLVVLFGKALPSLYRPWGMAGADVKVVCGEIDGVPDMLGIEIRSVIEAWSQLTLRAAG